MDAVTINVIWTVAIFVIFVAIVIWAYSKRSQKGFEEAANLVFDDDKSAQDKAQQNKQESSSNE